MMKTVLMVHNYYQIGGGEHTVFENEKKLLEENGHSVFVYTRSNDELKKQKWKLLLLPFTTLWSARTYHEVLKLIRDNKIDIVHCHNTFPLISPSVYYAARSLKVPVVQTIHNFRFLCPNGLFYCNEQICEKCQTHRSFRPAIENRCYRNSKIQTMIAAVMLNVHRLLGTYRKISYIFLTEFNRNKFSNLIDIHSDSVFIKPNFVSRTDLASNSRFIQSKFIFAGRLDENKGICFLLEAWAGVPSEFELHIYGDGPYRRECENAEKAHPNIRYYGFQSQETIFSDLADAAALIFPSALYEGFPMSLAESFALGRPALVSNIGNHGNIITVSGAGMVFEYGDVLSFQTALKEIVQNNVLYSEKADTYYRQNLTKESNYQKLTDIYEKVKHIPS